MKQAKIKNNVEKRAEEILGAVSRSLSYDLTIGTLLPPVLTSSLFVLGTKGDDILCRERRKMLTV